MDLPWPWGLWSLHPSLHGYPSTLQTRWYIFASIGEFLRRVVLLTGNFGRINDYGFLRIDADELIIAVNLR